MIIIGLVLQGLTGFCQRPDTDILPGAERMDRYLPMIGQQKIALVANHTSLVKGRHLVDTLIASGIGRGQLVKVFAPEHGFRGNYAAGATVRNGVDDMTGIPVVSLYGNNHKPSPEQLDGIDMVIFDLQDVGVRFYTYISTLTYVMEACAENHIPLLVLDRPNPNAFVDGPLLEPEFSSFVGMHPIPVAYGLTIGELAGMINGEGWLQGGLECDLKVIPCEHYRHGDRYPLPVGPSPNLPVEQAVMLYPSTCFFEGTVLSEGRGTPLPFQVFGHPELEGPFSFIPVSIPGVAEHPKFENTLCHGENLSGFNPPQGWTRLYLGWLIDSFRNFPDQEGFFTSYFELLAGTAALRQQIEAGWDEARIRESWQEDLAAYRQIRSKYLIYK